MPGLLDPSGQGAVIGKAPFHEPLVKPPASGPGAFFPGLWLPSGAQDARGGRAGENPLALASRLREASYSKPEGVLGVQEQRAPLGGDKSQIRPSSGSTATCTTWTAFAIVTSGGS